MSAIRTDQGLYLNSKLAATIFAIALSTNLGWLGWLSLQAMQVDRTTLTNAKAIESLAAMQTRTTIMLDQADSRLRSLEIQVARDGAMHRGGL
jgi:hypothetical protein